MIFKILLLFFVCVSSIFAYDYDHERDIIVSNYLKDIRKKGVFAAGVGGGALGEVSLISLHLDCNQSHTVESARLLFVECVEELLRRINQKKELRPHLKNYPLSIREISLFIIDFSQKTNPPKDFVAFMGLKGNDVYYFSYDHELEDYSEKHLLVESYADARDIYYKTILSQQNGNHEVK